MSASGLIPFGGTCPAKRKALQCGGWQWTHAFQPAVFIIAMCTFTSLVRGRRPQSWPADMSTRQMSSRSMKPLQQSVGEQRTRSSPTRTDRLPPLPSV